MTTAYSAYGNTAASTVLTSAAKLAETATGSSSTAASTTVAAGNGYYEMMGKGGSSSAQTSLPAPTGNGWLDESAVLEGNTIAAGTWTLEQQVSIASGTLNNVSFTYRVYKYNKNSGTYTAICSGTTSNFTLTTTPTNKAITVTGVSSVSFSTGDRLYFDTWMHAAPGSSRSIHLQLCADTSLHGIANYLEIDTPGYSSSATSNALRATTNARFLTSTPLSSRTRSHFITSKLLTSSARTPFFLRIGQSSRAKVNFLVWAISASQLLYVPRVFGGTLILYRTRGLLAPTRATFIVHQTIPFVYDTLIGVDGFDTFWGVNGIDAFPGVDGKDSFPGVDGTDTFGGIG